MNRFRSEKADVLIATDAAARRLDVAQLSHVFNYDLPSAPDVYVHRIGGTGRAGREGTAITLVDRPLGVQAFEIADQHQAKVATRRQARPALRGVEPLAQILDEAVEVLLVENLIQSRRTGGRRCVAGPGSRPTSTPASHAAVVFPSPSTTV